MRVLNYTKYEMFIKAFDAFGDLGDDEELGPADWSTVKRYIPCLTNLEANEHTHNVPEFADHLQRMSLSDIRVRLLNGVQAAYWVMLDEGRISQGAAILLMRSVDEAMDVVSTEPLCDWNGLKSNVHFPGYYRYLNMSRLPQRLVTYFTIERLDSACSLCAAFLRAHRTARRQLHEFIGDSDIASTVIGESCQEGEEAKRFLEDVRSTFPEVLHVVKTRQVTYSILKHLSEYVQNLQKVGLLEEKEMIHLDDAVQSDLKRLLRNPPLVKMPKLSDVIAAHPLLGALPPDVRERIGSSTKELIKVRGITLYKEGSKPNGIWLISTGVVRWESRSLSGKHSLHPTFCHGNTLGLYEVLLGKPYICDMITESVVHCFFFESEKILSLLRSDSHIEGFLWQESSLSISKILLPQIFEKMSMQEMRSLIAERSTMNTYIRGEPIQIRSNSVGLLLEGYIRNEDKQELIVSPAALFPSHLNLSIVGLESSGHSTACYHVETRARVIFFDLSATEVSGSSQTRAMSRLSQSMELTKTSFKEHEGLMSWPENFYKSRSSVEANIQQTSLSTRAMELSIYGSMVNDFRRGFSYTKKSSQINPSLSYSYPRVLMERDNGHPIVSVQSEGGSLKKRLDTKNLGTTTRELIPPLPTRRVNNIDHAVDSSDESDGEVIVRIDSPSTLSFLENN